MSSLWPIEEIPSSDRIFMRVNKVWLRDGDPSPSAFHDRGSSMSVDWEKYSAAEVTRARARRNPENNGVVAFNSATCEASAG
jgi:hypothetical protein